MWLIGNRLYVLFKKNIKAMKDHTGHCIACALMLQTQTRQPHYMLVTPFVPFLPFIPSHSNVIRWETAAHDLACLNCICSYEIKWRVDFILLPKLVNLIFCVHLTFKSQFTRTHTHKVGTKNLCMKYVGYINMIWGQVRSVWHRPPFPPTLHTFIILCMQYIILGYVYKLQQSVLSSILCNVT